MKFRNRLILGYAILAIAASFLIGGFYNYYLRQRYQTSIYNNARFTSGQVLYNLEGEMKKMEQVTLSLLSDLDVLQAIRDLSVKMRDPKENALSITEGKALVRNAVYTAYNLDNFYRVIVYNQYGYIAASGYMQERLVDTEVKVSEIPWIDSVQNTKGKDVLLPPHSDDWAAPQTKRQVFSTVKEIQGEKLGFIEVQQTEEYLQDLLSVPDQTIKSIVLKENGEVFWVSEGLEVEDYRQYFQTEDSVFDKTNQNTGTRELISIDTGKNTGLRLLTVQKWSDAAVALSSGLKSAVVIGLSFLALSLCFVVFMAYYLTKPLQELREKMERTQLSNLTDKIEIQSLDTDVQALTRAYRHLVERLSKSIEKEKKLSVLQLQAQFDTLQAQINPHFLYNVLNVISSRGMQDDDEVICEICGHLAAMLRYSTNTKTRYAAIQEEVAYTQQYFYLIKARFQDKVSLNIEMEERVMKEYVPKTVLQQIVENCINHGFRNSTGIMCVTIRGYFRDKGWYIQVSDNGQGFEEEALRSLQEKMEITKRRLFQERSNIELEIGGMGLINTYARLLLIYSDSLIFELKNTEEGAMVVFGAETRTEGIEENV